jgi:two-component sensor histidine kinase
MKPISNLIFINSNVMYGLLICLLLTANLNAQDAIQDQNQSTKDTINKLLKNAWKLGRTNPEKSLQILGRIDSINSGLDPKFKEDVVWYYYGVFYKNSNQFELSEQNFNKYQELHEKYNHKGRVASVNMAKANMFSDLGNYEKSSEAAALALKMYEEIPDTSGVIIAGNKLGYLLSEIDRFDEALKYLNSSAELAKLIAERRDEANAYTNIAIVYEKQKNFDFALNYYRKAYKIGESLTDDYSKFNNRYNMATIHQKRKNLDSAVYYGQKMIEISKVIDVPSISIVAKNLMSDLQADQGKMDEALKIIRSITDEEIATLGLKNKIENYKVAVKIYKQSGNYREAFESLELLKRYNDSLTGENARNKINELDIAYQTELDIVYETKKKEKQIALLDLENQNAQLQISRKNRTIIIVSIALALITLLSVILYVIIRKYLKQQKVLAKALDEKSLLLKEIHHRVKNNLQLVSSLLTLQGQSITDDIALRAINEGKSRVRSMALIHQDLYQTDNITSVSAQTYFLKLCNELFDTYNIKKDQIKLITHIEPLYLDVDTLIPIGLIINELITNALKYAFKGIEKGTIEISLKEEKNVLRLNVNDNGVGYDLNQLNTKSFGNKLIRSLIQQLDGSLETKIDHGTKISMAFKDYKISRESKN